MESEYRSEEPSQLVRNMYAMNPGSSVDDMYPEGISESQKPDWHQAVLRGMERRDPKAPRFPPIFLQTQARAMGLTAHCWEFRLYGPTDVPYHWNRSVEDAWELHEHFGRPQQEAPDAGAVGQTG